MRLPKPKTVAVLYARHDSFYKRIPHCDVWDVCRDARGWNGGLPVVAHPPCAQWGRLRGLANKNIAEKSLAVLAVAAVRLNGGVLEHPAGSLLWKHCRLPMPGTVDKWGGFTVGIMQLWFGHKAMKPTWLYICGYPGDLEPIQASLLPPTHVISTQRKKCRNALPDVPRKERHLTPVPLAKFLVDLAARCLPPILKR